MMQHLKEVATDVVVFLLAFVVSTGACTNKVVACDGQDRQAQAGKP